MAIDRQTILDTVYNGDGSLVDGIYPVSYTHLDVYKRQACATWC